MASRIRLEDQAVVYMLQAECGKVLGSFSLSWSGHSVRSERHCYVCWRSSPTPSPTRPCWVNMGVVSRFSEVDALLLGGCQDDVSQTQSSAAGLECRCPNGRASCLVSLVGSLSKQAGRGG